MTLLIDAWREVGRHVAIEESIARLTPILATALPVETLLVRKFDPIRMLVETVAEGGGGRGSPLVRKNSCPSNQVEPILSWSREGRARAIARQDRNEALTALVPSGVKGDVLAGPLSQVEGAAGAVLFISRTGETFDDGHLSLLQLLLEPFAVAFENDRRARELQSLREAVEADNRSLRSRLGRSDLSEIVGASSGLRPVMERVEQVAASDVPVLIFGETGSGKEVVARAIHSGSTRSSGPFLRVNCGAIPPELIDSELFGHEKGSFTGAVNERKGWFERADGGTLFLDECGELPLAAQVRLLRILQDGAFERVGGEKQINVDVRIVAATHRDLHAMVADGRFRQDLWYRMAIFPIHLPPLRDRACDIAEMAKHFSLRAAKRFGMAPLAPSPEDIRLLANYPWPGNVRELRAVMERAAILGDGRRLEVAKALGASVGPSVSSPNPTSVGKEQANIDPVLTIDAAMARHIEIALSSTQGKIEGPTGAAKLLGINPHTLRARMRKLGVDWRKFRPNT